MRPLFAAAATGYAAIAATIALTVYGQLVFKWRIDAAGEVPGDTSGRLEYALGLLLDPWMITVGLSVIAASVSWWAALREFELSFAYPFMALTFVLVFVLSGPLFGETVSVAKIAGLTLVVAGLIVGSQ